MERRRMPVLNTVLKCKATHLEAKGYAWPGGLSSQKAPNLNLSPGLLSEAEELQAEDRADKQGLQQDGSARLKEQTMTGCLHGTCWSQKHASRNENWSQGGAVGRFGILERNTRKSIKPLINLGLTRQKGTSERGFAGREAVESGRRRVQASRSMAGTPSDLH
eukprot:1136681-Pelagomonas_calceolata.AAC.4